MIELRKIAAILAADVVGFSRLTGADEDRTLARLRALRSDLIDPTIAVHNGRVVKRTGDGVLVEFRSVVDAVRCAIEVQNCMVDRNAGLPPERRIEFRIGVHLGDIVEESDGDLMGDGVNIAARLEGIAEPGAICLSEDAYRQVKSRLNLSVRDLGEIQLKNIAEPIRVYSIMIGIAAPTKPGIDTELTARSVASALPVVPDKPSIAVLAFTNMSGDPEQDYFSDGIAEDLITDLSKIGGLFVIARNSAFSYKGRSVEVRSLARALGVRYVLEGSVRKSGTRIRVTAQLVDGTTGGQLWAERYDRNLTDIFAVQDELTTEIVGALSPKLIEAVNTRVRRKGTSNLAAYDHFLRAREIFPAHSKESAEATKAELEKAIKLDPDFSLPHAFMSAMHVLDYTNAWSSAPDESLRLATDEAKMAIALDEREPVAHFRLSSVLLWSRQHDEAIAAAQRAISIDPNFADGYANLGRTLHFAGHAQEGIPHIEQSMRLDPHYSDIVLHFLTECYFHTGRYSDAVESAKRRIVRNPKTDITRVLLAASFGHLGNFSAARAVWADLMEVNPSYSLQLRRRTLPYKNPADFERIVQGISVAGILG